MRSQLRPALTLFAVLSLITGVFYPLVITGIAQLAFADTANGSIIMGKDGKPLGSSLIGQDFSAGDPQSGARWFWARPSATGPVPFTALNLDKGTGSSGSNLAAANPALLANVKARVDAIAMADAAASFDRPAGQAIPIDLVTSSASGLDPHISPAAALYQLPRVAKARGIDESSLQALVTRHTTGRLLGLLGEPVVNVLELNLELESMHRP